MSIILAFLLSVGMFTEFTLAFERYLSVKVFENLGVFFAGRGVKFTLPLQVMSAGNNNRKIRDPLPTADYITDFDMQN